MLGTISRFLLQLAVGKFSEMNARLKSNETLPQNAIARVILWKHGCADVEIYMMS